MGRKPNDDRSDSLNPNNDAYWASLENHRNQIEDDDCGDLLAKSPVACMVSAVPSLASVKRTRNENVETVDIQFPLPSTETAGQLDEHAFKAIQAAGFL